MIKRKNRIYIALYSYFLSMIGMFFTGTAWWFLLTIIAVVYIFAGGRKHVWFNGFYRDFCILCIAIFMGHHIDDKNCFGIYGSYKYKRKNDGYIFTM